MPVLLFHGFTGSTETWQSYVKRWKHYRLIVIDLPGHGQTHTEVPVSTESFCEDVSELLTQLEIKRCHIVGYSMGGRMALSFAMLYPRQVVLLVLESASPGLANVDEQIARQAKDETLATMLEEQGITTFVDKWENIPLFDSQKQLPETIKQRIREERLQQSPSGLAASLRGMGTGSQPAWWNKLSECSVPVLLVVGAYDHKFVAIANKMKKQLPFAALHVISKAGHAIHVEQMELFDTIVTEFLNRFAKDGGFYYDN